MRAVRKHDPPYRVVYRAAGLPDAQAALKRFLRWCEGVTIPELSRLAGTVRA